MTPEEYQQLALVTEHTPDFVRLTGVDSLERPYTPAHNRMIARMLHAVLGMMSEIGEIADALKKHIIYGADLDTINLVEEHGDESWYQNLFIDAAGSSWQESWTKNIAKLKARFGGRFTAAAALTRDLVAERAALEVRPTVETAAAVEAAVRGFAQRALAAEARVRELEAALDRLGAAS